MRGSDPVVIGVALLMLCGCAGAVDATTATPATGPSEDRVVEFWYMPNGPDPASHLRDEVERFEEVHPGTRVDLVELPWESALTRIITAATSGSGPDAVQIGTTWVPGIAELGALAPLSEEDIRVLGGRDAFVPASWTSTSAAGSDDTVAVPWFLDTRAGFYRTDLFDDLDLDPAQAFADWDAFEATLQDIQADGRMHPLAVSGANDWNVVHDLAPWIWAAGGSYLTADATAPAVGAPAAVDGIDVYQRLVATYNHPDALAVGVHEAQDLFVTGEAAITFGGSSVVNDLRTAEGAADLAVEEWGTIPFPAGPTGRQAFLGGSNLALFGNAGDPEAARSWIAFLTSEASQLRYTQAIGMLPARQAALQDELLLDDAGFRPFVDQLADGRQYPPLSEWLHVEVALQHHLGRMWQQVAATGPLDRDEVARRMRAADADVREVLDGGG